MKRYLLFGSHERYDYGQGWQEFVDSFDKAFLAVRAAVRAGYDWYQVVDTKTLEVVSEEYKRIKALSQPLDK